MQRRRPHQAKPTHPPGCRDRPPHIDYIAEWDGFRFVTLMRVYQPCDHAGFSAKVYRCYEQGDFCEAFVCDLGIKFDKTILGGVRVLNTEYHKSVVDSE